MMYPERLTIYHTRRRARWPLYQSAVLSAFAGIGAGLLLIWMFMP